MIKRFMETVKAFFRRWKRKETVLIVPPKRAEMDSESKIRLTRPVGLEYPISSPYGVMRTIQGIKRIHNGIDFATPVGTVVKAMISGRVFRAGFENPLDPDQGYGLRIWQETIIDGKPFYLWYSHLSDLGVADGDEISEGQEIGLTGNTGRSTGPHLHVSVRQKNTGNYFDMEFA